MSDTNLDYLQNILDAQGSPMADVDIEGTDVTGNEAYQAPQTVSILSRSQRKRLDVTPDQVIEGLKSGDFVPDNEVTYAMVDPTGSRKNVTGNEMQRALGRGWQLDTPDLAMQRMQAAGQQRIDEVAGQSPGLAGQHTFLNTLPFVSSLRNQSDDPEVNRRVDEAYSEQNPVASGIGTTLGVGANVASMLVPSIAAENLSGRVLGGVSRFVDAAEAAQASGAYAGMASQLTPRFSTGLRAIAGARRAAAGDSVYDAAMIADEAAFRDHDDTENPFGRVAERVALSVGLSSLLGAAGGLAGGTRTSLRHWINGTKKGVDDATLFGSRMSAEAAENAAEGAEALAQFSGRQVAATGAKQVAQEEVGSRFLNTTADLAGMRSDDVINGLDREGVGSLLNRHSLMRNDAGNEPLASYAQRVRAQADALNGQALNELKGLQIRADELDPELIQRHLADLPATMQAGEAGIRRFYDASDVATALSGKNGAGVDSTMKRLEALLPQREAYEAAKNESRTLTDLSEMMLKRADDVKVQSQTTSVRDLLGGAQRLGAYLHNPAAGVARDVGEVAMRKIFKMFGGVNGLKTALAMRGVHGAEKMSREELAEVGSKVWGGKAMFGLLDAAAAKGYGLLKYGVDDSTKKLMGVGRRGAALGTHEVGGDEDVTMTSLSGGVGDKRRQAVAAGHTLLSAAELIERNGTDIGKMLSPDAPNVAMAYDQQIKRNLKWLASKAPTKSTDPIDGDRLPTLEEAENFERFVEAGFQPQRVIKRIKNGTVTPQHIEGMKAMWPKAWEEVVTDMAKLRPRNENERLGYTKALDLVSQGRQRAFSAQRRFTSERIAAMSGKERQERGGGGGAMNLPDTSTGVDSLSASVGRDI